MADTAVYTSCDNAIDDSQGLKGPYWVSTTVAAIIFVDDQDDLYFTLTDDGGATWAETQVVAGTVQSLACWFDQETPGDSGTLVHMAWLDADDKAYYRTVDVSDGSLGTLRTIEAGLAGSAYFRISITKTVGGNLLCAYLLFGVGADFSCYRSVDSGANWTARADVFENSLQPDWLLLFPADTADNQDACAIYWQYLAHEISIKMYDDSEDSWTETAIAGSMTEDISHINMDGAVRHSDKAILLAAHSDDDNAGDDLVTWEILPDSIADPTITAKTNIFTDQAESAQVAVLINQQNDDVYVAYLKGDGTWLSTVDVVFHKSVNDMAAWGGEQAYSEAAPDDNRLVHGGRTVGSAGGWIQWSFYNDDELDIFVNLVNDIEIAAGGEDALVDAVLATATAVGLVAVVTGGTGVTVSGELATAAAEGLVAVISGGTGATVSAVLAEAVAAALLPTITGGALVSGELAEAVAAGLVATITGGTGATVSAVLAEAVAAGLVAVVTGGTGATVSAELAEAVAAGLVPVVTGDALVTSVLAEAVAVGLVAVVTGGTGATVSATLAEAVAEALIPVVTGESPATVYAVVAEAVAAGLVPIVTGGTGVTVSPAVATALAEALVPRIITLFIQLTLESRSTDLTLESRSRALTLESRSRALTLEARSFALTLASRSFALTLPTRE